MEEESDEEKYEKGDLNRSANHTNKEWDNLKNKLEMVRTIENKAPAVYAVNKIYTIDRKKESVVEV